MKPTIEIGDVARPVSRRATSECPLPVYSVTKHDGMVPSSDYFKKQVYSRDVEGYKIVSKGQFAYATIHLDEGSVGVLETADECVVSPMYTVFEVDESRVHRPYLLRLLKSPWALKQYTVLGNGSVHRRRSISFEALSRLEVSLPSIAEQQRASRILDKADSLRRKRQEAIQLVDEFLRAVFVDMFGDPGSNPKRFEVGTIRDVVASANYGTAEKASEEVGKYAILRMNNITYQGGWDFSSLKYVNLEPATAHKYLARQGDLLFNRTNSKELVGKTAVYMRDEPMAIAGYLVRVRMNERGNPHYVSGYLNSAHGKQTLASRAKSIVGMANINAQEMQDIPLLLPPKELQDKFGRIVEEVTRRASKHQAFAQQADELNAALANQFFCTAPASP